MSRWPTGVSVITGLATDLAARGLDIGSFTSVSLDPPLVGFFVKRESTSWQDMRAQGHFCVNVLATEQTSYVGQFSKGDVRQRFEGLPMVAPNAVGIDRPPRLVGCAAWIDADIVQEIELGDHLKLVGQVTDMSSGEATHTPLVFAQGRLQRPQVLTSLAANHFENWESALLALLP
jgi:flavin reductase (DIM6/NTAB) family NADH-FMN oxidoreductase RutF